MKARLVMKIRMKIRTKTLLIAAAVFEITGDPQRFRRAKAYVSSGLATGALVPVIDQVFDLDDVVQAHQRMETRGRFGKIVITVGTTDS